MLDRLDDTLEYVVRNMHIRVLWDEMKENAHLATTSPTGGVRLFLKYLAELKELFRSGSADWVKAPNNYRMGSIWSSKSSHHGDFDDDEPTLRSTLARILVVEQTDMALSISRSASSLSDRRKMFEAA